MGIVKQLYQLQEVDLELESNERLLRQMVSQLGENQAVVRAQTKLASEQKRLSELRHRQRALEWEIDDLTSKLTATEEQLYSGRIKNPKELTSLQHEVNILKAKRDQLETSVLEIMDQVELAEASVSALSGEFKKLEAEWQNQQQQLSAEIEKLKDKLSELKHRRKLLSAEIAPQVVELYDRLKKQKGQAVAKVEQGICRGCRISLPFSELQRARGGDLVQCSSCGRILFLP
jgi:hypothetical protein